jgi:hypothetical protein
MSMNTKLFGSGTTVGAPMVASGEKLVAVIVPSRPTPSVTANPLIVSVVSAGTVPAVSENMLKANSLPDVDIPSGENTAGPYSPTVNERLEPNLKS